MHLEAGTLDRNVTGQSPQEDPTGTDCSNGRRTSENTLIAREQQGDEVSLHSAVVVLAARKSDNSSGHVHAKSRATQRPGVTARQRLRRTTGLQGRRGCLDELKTTPWVDHLPTLEVGRGDEATKDQGTHRGS